MSPELENGDADWALAENVKNRRLDGTYIPVGEPDTALDVTVNGGGTLGTGGDTLVVEPGTGQVQSSEHTIQQSDDRSLDVDLPGGNDRRDVVYLSDAGTLEIRRGRGGELAWGDGVASGARTFRNAYRPPPPDLVGVPGLVLAVVTVRSGRNTLDSDAVEQIDVRAPLGDQFPGGTVRGDAIQASLDGAVVPIAEGVGVVDGIDATAATPVQDAVDALGGAQGMIQLPPSDVTNSGTITLGTGQGIRGWGPGDQSTAGRCSLIKNDTNSDCIQIANNGPSRYNTLRDFSVEGMGPDTPTGKGIHCDPQNIGNQTGRLVMDNVSISKLSDSALYVASDWVECRIGSLITGSCDGAASGNAVVDFENTGYANRIGLLAVYPSQATSGTTSHALATRGFGNLTVGTLNVGGTARSALLAEGDDGLVTVGGVNLEPAGYATDSEAVIIADGEKVVTVNGGVMRVGGFSAGYVARGASNGNNSFGIIRQNSTATLNGPMVDIQADTTAPINYTGMSADVTNNTGAALSTGVACLGDLTMVT